MIKLCAFADEYSKDIKSQIEGLKKNNISLIELRSVDGINVINFTDEMLIKVKTELDKNKIKVWSIGSPLGKADITVDFNEYLVKVNKIIKIAKQLGAKKIRGFSFFNAYDNKSEVFRRLQVIADLCKAENITYCHENEKEVYGDTLERVIEIQSNVKNIDFIFDPANYLQCGEDINACLQTLFETTDYFHVKDVDLLTGELVPAGYGNGEILKLIKMLKNKDAVLTLEPHLKVFEGYGAIDNTVMKNKFNFDTNEQAFDFALLSLKKLFIKEGYKEVEGGFTL